MKNQNISATYDGPDQLEVMAEQSVLPDLQENQVFVRKKSKLPPKNLDLSELQSQLAKGQITLVRSSKQQRQQLRAVTWQSEQQWQHLAMQIAAIAANQQALLQQPSAPQKPVYSAALSEMMLERDQARATIARMALELEQQKNLQQELQQSLLHHQQAEQQFLDALVERQKEHHLQQMRLQQELLLSQEHSQQTEERYHALLQLHQQQAEMQRHLQQELRQQQEKSLELNGELDFQQSRGQKHQDEMAELRVELAQHRSQAKLFAHEQELLKIQLQAELLKQDRYLAQYSAFTQLQLAYSELEQNSSAEQQLLLSKQSTLLQERQRLQARCQLFEDRQQGEIACLQEALQQVRMQLQREQQLYKSEVAELQQQMTEYRLRFEYAQQQLLAVPTEKAPSA